MTPEQREAARSILLTVRSVANGLGVSERRVLDAYCTPAIKDAFKQAVKLEKAGELS
jgi:hypothetical protein